MLKALFVTKHFNTYADTFLMLGLAQIAEYALSQTQQNTPMQLVDEGTRYRIQFKKPVNLEPITQLNYTNPFPPVCGQKTDRDKLPPETPIFDVVKQTEIRKLYREYLFQTRNKPGTEEDTPKPSHPSTQNGAILTSLRHDRNHNDLWLQGWELRDNYGALITSILQAFSEETHAVLNPEIERVADLFKQATGRVLPTQASAVKIFLPTAVQGVSRVKADSNKTDAQKADWLSLWLIASGLFALGISERVKISDRIYDWRVTALEPHDIQFGKYQAVLNRLRQYNPPSSGHGIARFDAELVLRLCQELLNHHKAQASAQHEDELDIWEPINHFVGGFAGTHFGQKGQVYGVKEVFNLGLPGWIRPKTYQDLLDYQTILIEHLSVISSLSAEEGHSELLALYRDFITGTNSQKFFHFQVSYADYVVKRLADTQARTPRLFSLFGINLMTQNFKHRKSDQEWSLTEITQNPGFLRIAQAINSATVYAGTVRDKNGQPKETGWERIYGLAQRLSSQSGSKKDFIIEISAFLASYENENLRIAEELRNKGKPQRIWTTKEDLDRLIHLIDKFGSSLVANLLIAYGYAKGWGKAKESGAKNLTPNLLEETELTVEEFDEGESDND